MMQGFAIITLGLLMGLLPQAAVAQSVCGSDDVLPWTSSAVRRCSKSFKGVNLTGKTLVENWMPAKTCSSCKEACWNMSKRGKGCNVWVFCDNPNGCDNGYGDILPAHTCTLKHQEDVHSLIVNPTAPPAAYAKPANAASSYDDWVSGACEICNCCGWCGNAHACQNECYYCEATRKCASRYLATSLYLCQSKNCKDRVKDANRTDCVQAESCGGDSSLCPGTMYLGVGNTIKPTQLRGEPKKCE